MQRSETAQFHSAVCAFVYLQAVPGLLETSPGVRSCMIEYDQRVLPLAKLLALLEQVEGEMPSVSAGGHSCLLSSL